MRRHSWGELDWDAWGAMVKSTGIQEKDPKTTTKHFGGVESFPTWRAAAMDRLLKLGVMLTHPFERKVPSNIQTRFERTRGRLKKILGLPGAPQIESDLEDELAVTIERIKHGESLLDILRDEDLNESTKLERVQEAINLLQSVHARGIAHGDAFPKNFVVCNDRKKSPHLIIKRFEEGRWAGTPKDYWKAMWGEQSVESGWEREQDYDFLLLMAGVLNNTRDIDVHKIYALLDGAGVNIHFPFDLRDHLYFKLRFFGRRGARGFFRHFSSGMTRQAANAA